MTGDLPALLRLSVTHPEGRDKVISVYTQQVKPDSIGSLRRRVAHTWPH